MNGKSQLLNKQNSMAPILQTPQEILKIGLHFQFFLSNSPYPLTSDTTIQTNYTKSTRLICLLTTVTAAATMYWKLTMRQVLLSHLLKGINTSSHSRHVLLSLVYKWENWGVQNLINLPKAKLLIRYGNEIWTQAV